MRRLLVGVFAVALMASAGCQNKDDNMNRSRVDADSNTARTASADVCTHCPGKQTATAQGTCPSCGMKVTQ